MFLASLLAMAFAIGGMFFLLFLFVAAISTMSKPPPVIVENSVLVFDLSVNIQDRPVAVSPEDFIGGALGRETFATLSLRSVVASLEAAAKDDRIKALYLTGSLQPAGYGAGFPALKDVREAIKEFAATGKPVWAYVVGPSSRDLYVISAADRVYLNPEGLLDSAGLVMGSPYLGAFMAKYGIGIQVTRAGAYKSAAEMFALEGMSEPAREASGALMADMWGELVAAISEGAGLEPGRFEELVNEKGILTARDAAEHGIVDRLAFPDEVIDDLSELVGLDDEGAAFRQTDFLQYLKSTNAPRGYPDGYVAVVYAEGAIVAGEGNAGEVGGDRLSREIRALRADDKVKAIVLRVNSPGGSALASELIQRELRLAKEKMPVVVSMGTLAASGGYWISAYADKIFAQPNTITGSIGVIGMFFNVQKLAETHGVNFDLVKSARYADMLSVFRPKSDAEMAIVQRWVDEVYDSFLGKVAEGRSLPLQKVQEIAGGRVWSGADALDLGLVDALGGLQDAIDFAGEKAGLGANPPAKDFPEARDFFKELMTKLEKGAASGDNAVLAEARALYRDLEDASSTFNDPKGVYSILPYSVNVR